jgi:hypothetical protein
LATLAATLTAAAAALTLAPSYGGGPATHATSPASHGTETNNDRDERAGRAPETVVIGPDASLRRVTVLNWRGINYVQQDACSRGCRLTAQRDAAVRDFRRSLRSSTTALTCSLATLT